MIVEVDGEIVHEIILSKNRYTKSGTERGNLKEPFVSWGNYNSPQNGGKLSYLTYHI